MYFLSYRCIFLQKCGTKTKREIKIWNDSNNILIFKKEYSTNKIQTVSSLHVSIGKEILIYVF